MGINEYPSIVEIVQMGAKIKNVQMQAKDDLVDKMVEIEKWKLEQFQNIMVPNQVGDL